MLLTRGSERWAPTGPGVRPSQEASDVLRQRLKMGFREWVSWVLWGRWRRAPVGSYISPSIVDVGAQPSQPSAVNTIAKKVNLST